MRLVERVACAAIAASISLAPMPCSVVHARTAFNEEKQVAFDKDGVETSPLLEELQRRTKANAEKNSLAVKSVTESNAFTAIEGYAPKSYKKTAANCVFEKCTNEAKPAAKLDAKVDPMQVMTSEFNRVKQGLSDKLDDSDSATSPPVVDHPIAATSDAVAEPAATPEAVADSLS